VWTQRCAPESGSFSRSVSRCCRTRFSGRACWGLLYCGVVVALRSTRTRICTHRASVCSFTCRTGRVPCGVVQRRRRLRLRLRLLLLLCPPHPLPAPGAPSRPFCHTGRVGTGRTHWNCLDGLAGWHGLFRERGHATCLPLWLVERGGRVAGVGLLVGEVAPLCVHLCAPAFVRLGLVQSLLLNLGGTVHKHVLIWSWCSRAVCNDARIPDQCSLVGGLQCCAITCLNYHHCLYSLKQPHRTSWKTESLPCSHCWSPKRHRCYLTLIH
jgi:hypothetical protein